MGAKVCVWKRVWKCVCGSVWAVHEGNGETKIEECYHDNTSRRNGGFRRLIDASLDSGPDEGVRSYPSLLAGKGLGPTSSFSPFLSATATVSSLGKNEIL